MPREKPLYVPVENKSDDALCPECNEKMWKSNSPNFPMSDPPKSAHWTGITGHAFCVNADCPVHEEVEIVDWSYERGSRHPYLTDPWDRELTSTDSDPERIRDISPLLWAWGPLLREATARGTFEGWRHDGTHKEAIEADLQIHRD